MDDFRKNARGELGTRTATLQREGVLKLRRNWIYRDPAQRREARSFDRLGRK